MVDDTREEAQIPVVWAGNEDIQVLLANQFLGQVGPHGEVVLTFGQLVPPALMGEPGQVAEQVRQMAYVSTNAVARIGLTRFGLDELIRVLNETRENYERAERAREGGEG